MEINLFDIMEQQLAEVIKEKSFEKQDDGSYKNGEYSFKIESDENSGLVKLMLGTVSEEIQYVTVSSWAFNPEKGEKEAKTIGKDFAETLAAKIGLKKNRLNSAADVPLPSQKSSAKATDINGLTQRMLAIFPAYKDAYREHVAANGELLCVDFFSETFTKEIRNVLDEGNKKQLKKLFDALGELYVEGDRNTQNLVAVILVTGAVAGNDERFNTAVTYMENCAYLKKTVTILHKNYKSKNKKLHKMIKE